MAKNKVKKSPYKRPVPSTQKNTPIKDIVNGTIITNDGNFIKIIEVEPTPFFLKKINEQNKIGSLFKTLLKTAPSQLHIKTLAISADMSNQIEKTKENIENEESEECKQMGKEYLEKLNLAQKYGVTRKFYISFPYEGNKKISNPSDLSRIIYNLNIDAERIKSSLLACGNSVVKENDDEDTQISEIFYTIYNREKYLTETYEQRANEVYSRYINEHKENAFIPPADLIAPEKISYEDPKYLIINNTYYSFLYIPSYGYNPDVITGWIDNFVDSFIGVDVDIFLKRIPPEYVMAQLKRSITLTQVNMSDTNQNSDAYEDTATTFSSAQYLRNGLRSGEDFYYMATVLTVSGDSPESVAFKINELKKKARAIDVTLRENKFNFEKTFNMVLPTGTWDDAFFKKMRRNVLTDGASTMYPFTTFEIMDKNGAYIADDLRTGSPIILDQFNSKRTANPAIFICGESGAGKTVAIMLMALRARIQHKKVFILAPEKEDEFKRLVDAIGGQFVSLGSGSRNRINVMEIFMKDESGQEKKMMIDGTSDYSTTSYLSEKISTLMEFFQLHIPDISIEEKQLLNEAIIRTYASKGINRNNNSLWADKEHTGYKKMPIIKDLVDELEKSNETRRLARAIGLLTTGVGSHFNGQTNVNVNNDFFVIGLEKNSKDMLGLSIYAAMDYCWSKIKEDRTKQKLLIMDEWWRMAFNPIAADASLEISKIARAYSCSMIIATQQMSDILAFENGKYGNAVLNNCATKIIMRMRERDIKIVDDMIDLSESEISSILRFDTGSGLLIAGDNRIRMKFTPSETEKLLTFTDSATLNEYVERKKIRLMKEKEAKAYQEAEQLDSIFTTIKADGKDLNNEFQAVETNALKDKESSQ